MPLIYGRKKLAGPPAVPTNDAGLRLWVRGNVGITLVSGGVSAWANQAVAAWAAGTQTTAGRRATMSTLNGIAAPLFDGVDDNVNFVPNQTLPAFTIQVVSKLTAIAAAQQVLLEVSDNFSFADRGPSIVQTTTRRNGREPYVTATDVGIAFNATTAVVDTYTCQATIGGTPATVAFYRNGVLAQTFTEPSGDGNPRTFVQFRVGANRSNAQGFNGILADVAVWNNVLTPTRILAQANGAKSRWLIP